MKRWLSPWFKIDSRALGIYRILIGLVCTLDIVRRWNYIDVFYSNQGIPMDSDFDAFIPIEWLMKENPFIFLSFLLAFLSVFFLF